MRFFLPIALALLAGCGQSPDAATSDEPVNDTAMNAQTPPSDNTLSDAEKNEGWQLLFDGQTTAGWHGYLLKEGVGNWKVSDGQLLLDTASKEMGSSLTTDNEYENFHLKIDWKISTGGNSGIIFGVKEDPQYEYDYFTGPEMQVQDDVGFPHPVTEKQKAGSLYDLVAASSASTKPVGEWNTAEIIKNNDSLEFKLNGTTVVTTTLWNDHWKEMVAGSKFKRWPAFGTFKSGKISLQNHGSPVWYKNIKLKKL